MEENDTEPEIDQPDASQNISTPVDTPTPAKRKRRVRSQKD